MIKNNGLKYFLAAVFYCLLSVVVLIVYGESLEPVLYSFGLFAIFFIIFLVIDYFKRLKKLRKLDNYLPFVSDEISAYIKAETNEEEKYQEIIEQLLKEVRTINEEKSKREKEISDFYTLWVHQIKTPIAALDLLLQTTPDNTSDLKSELFKIERYVDIILGYLRMDDLNNDLTLKHYSLEDIVKQALRKYAPLFIKSHLSLDKQELSETVLTDEKWILIVLEQILSNAIKYTPQGKISIYSNQNRTDKQITTQLIIEDTGIGISKEDLPRICERAFTGYNGRVDKKASGLGLYLSDRIIKQLGHKLIIESQPGVGTKVVIEFTELTIGDGV